MAGKELQEIHTDFLTNEGPRKIDESVAHEILSIKGRVLMIFRRVDGSLFGYEASEITDLNHAKKVQLVDFEGFFKID